MNELFCSLKIDMILQIENNTTLMERIFLESIDTEYLLLP